MPKHTPTPWATFGDVDESVCAADHAFIANFYTVGRSHEENAANAARAVVCVNGCRDIPNPAAVGELVRAAKTVVVGGRHAPTCALLLNPRGMQPCTCGMDALRAALTQLGGA